VKAATEITKRHAEGLEKSAGFPSFVFAFAISEEDS